PWQHACMLAVPGKQRRRDCFFLCFRGFSGVSRHGPVIARKCIAGQFACPANSSQNTRMNGILGNRVASRRYSPAPVGARIGAVARAAFAKRGFTQSHVLAHWPEIAGAQLAEFSSPEKLIFPRASGEGA